MKTTTLRFPSLQSLSECMFLLGITKPVIDYTNYLITAELSEKQLDYARECGAEIVHIIVSE